MMSFALSSGIRTSCHCSTYDFMDLKFRCIRSTPMQRQSRREKFFECFASTGVKSPFSIMLSQTVTLRPGVLNEETRV